MDRQQQLEDQQRAEEYADYDLRRQQYSEGVRKQQEVAQHNDLQRLSSGAGMPMGFPPMSPFGGIGLPGSPMLPSPYGSQVPPYNGQRPCVVPLLARR